MPAGEVLPVPRFVGVGIGGHRIEDLCYCHTCKLYFVDANAYNIHLDLHSIMFECTCSFCNEQLMSAEEFALHFLQKHPDKRHTGTSVDESPASKMSKTSNELST